MSFVYDTMSRAWEMMSVAVPDSEVKVRFGLMINAMHEANHKLKDAINHDKSVRVQAEKIDAALGTLTVPAIVSREVLVKEARSLKSEHGENPEYDRALAELVYWTAGGESVEAVRAEILKA